MKGGAFKLNMHPKEFFDRNPYHEDGKTGKKPEEKERSQSAPSDKKPFKYSSPGKSVCSIDSLSKKGNNYFLLFS